jgi:hypothetical protein
LITLQMLVGVADVAEGDRVKYRPRGHEFTAYAGFSGTLITAVANTRDLDSGPRRRGTENFQGGEFVDGTRFAGIPLEL